MRTSHLARRLHAAGRSGRLVMRTAAVVAALGGITLATAVDAAAVPPGTVTTGPISVSGITVNGTGLNYALVTQNGKVTVSGSYAVDEQGGAIDQIEIGWRGSSKPLGCVYSGGSGSGNFTFAMGRPPKAGLNQVIVNYAQNFSCQTNAWWGSNDGPVIADLAVKPPNAGSNGPISVSNVKLGGTNSNVQAGNRSVTVTGSYAIGDVGGAATQIQIGWQGQPLATTCLANGGAFDSGTFRVNIGLPPTLGANYVVVDYSQQFSCKRQWWAGTSEPPGTTAVGLVYNNES